MTWQEHLDECTQCRNIPGGVCATGARVLEKMSEPTIADMGDEEILNLYVAAGTDATNGAGAEQIADFVECYTMRVEILKRMKTSKAT